MATSHYVFYKTDNDARCEGCGKLTRCVVEPTVHGSDHPNNTLEGPAACCPRCSRTVGRWSIITGTYRWDVSVFSSMGRQPTDSVPWQEQFTPMRAQAFKNLNQKRKLLTLGPDWYAGIKYDGVRILAYIYDEDTHFLSRNKARGHRGYGIKTGALEHLSLNIPELDGTVLDGEVVWPHEQLVSKDRLIINKLNAAVAITNSLPEKAQTTQQEQGYLHYVVFDILKYKGHDVRAFPLRDRLEKLDEIMAIIQADPDAGEFYHTERRCFGDEAEKYKFYQEVIQDGHEGIMLKDLNSRYTGRGRPFSWVKRKLRYGADGFITGYHGGEIGTEFEGMVGSIIVSAYTDASLTETKAIAVVSGLPMELRRAMTDKDGSMKSEWYGKTVEVLFQEISSRKQRGRHAILYAWRPDKDKEECLIDNELRLVM